MYRIAESSSEDLLFTGPPMCTYVIYGRSDENLTSVLQQFLTLPVSIGSNKTWDYVVFNLWQVLRIVHSFTVCYGGIC